MQSLVYPPKVLAASAPFSRPKPPSPRPDGPWLKPSAQASGPGVPPPRRPLAGPARSRFPPGTPISRGPSAGGPAVSLPFPLPPPLWITHRAAPPLPSPPPPPFVPQTSCDGPSTPPRPPGRGSPLISLFVLLVERTNVCVGGVPGCRWDGARPLSDPSPTPCPEEASRWQGQRAQDFPAPCTEADGGGGCGERRVDAGTVWKTQPENQAGLVRSQGIQRSNPPWISLGIWHFVGGQNIRTKGSENKGKSGMSTGCPKGERNHSLYRQKRPLEETVARMWVNGQ